MEHRHAARRRTPQPLPRPLLRCAGVRAYLLAWDPVAQKARWRNDFRPSGGVLSTAGGLIFAGDAGGTFHAFDPATGATLWTHDVLPGVATPVSYMVDGRQYVAVLSGTRGGRVFAFALDAK